MSGVLKILQHTLGVDEFGRGTQYRNHFVTGAGSIDHPICMEAVELGLMKRQEGHPLSRGDDVFSATAAGKEWMADNSPVPQRDRRVIQALGRRISDQGDMHIRVSRHTIKILMQTLGFTRWDAGDEDFREVDALALNILQALAEKALKL